ncbi:ribosome recycling factor [Buchnera aphidicola str. Bp (Baizongia pistaciae)]|uniref:Ribosome-recycling factor n=1 Tax=Buchnera aphidicola subsp. Baizongia pistaciae (strain Bp) TaxID=224915 RepID=RRF_BUCBP|nr:ribosome recycling factor [Buchnera aphidicola]Q89AP1.1 RecName: Full=Ribosome-recycling factor; Short=RRF; AltName: Full=Ribosome-releasing factor [Buchnera aphidicola str. Bp (Baizongia pistaciae)]AAO26948.1 ribosome recycling factor [Buchnera aphidicola str. Bp (Baizongia pistaciae)]
MERIKNFTSSKMDHCVHMFVNQLNTLRSSRASPSILDTILIDYLGQKIQLKKLSNIIVENVNTLRITLFDPKIKNNVEKAIISSKLDLIPIFINNYFQIKIPVLTEERRLQLIKLAKKMAENSRICIRNIRRLSNEKIKLFLKDKIISSDKERRLQHEVQDITNSYMEKINVILSKKEKDLLK